MIAKRIVLAFRSKLNINSTASQFIARAILASLSKIVDSNKMDEIISSKFAVTDLLPWIQSDPRIYLKPKPLLIPYVSGPDLSRVKLLKKASYVQESLLTDYSDKVEQYIKGKNPIAINSGLLIETSTTDVVTIHHSIDYHNQMLRHGDKQGSEGRALYFENTRWLSNGGLYFDLLLEEAEFVDTIVAGIRLLGDLGIGRGTSKGNGMFDVIDIKDVADKYEINGTNLGLLLSHYIPSTEEIENDLLNNLKFYDTRKYQPIKREQGVHRPGLKSANLIKSGSIMEHPSEIIIGDAVDIGFENPNIVWGKAIVEGIEL